MTDIQYRDETIRFDQDAERWVWDRGSLNNDSLVALKDAIDNALAAEIITNPVDAIVEYVPKHFVPVVLVKFVAPSFSIPTNSYWGVRTAEGNERRNQYRKIIETMLYKDTPTNRQRVGAIRNRQDQIVTLNQEIETIYSQMERFTKADWDAAQE